MREAELFVMAEHVLAEVIGRIRGEQWDIVLPPCWTGRGPIGRLRCASASTTTPATTRGCRTCWPGGPWTTSGGTASTGTCSGPTRSPRWPGSSTAACAAAGRVQDGDAVVHADRRDLAVRDYLSELTITRALLAHEIAMQLGSRACPLTEELVRGLCDGTEKAAGRWRAAGFFREPMPLPVDVSWRDRFLLLAGRDPHALEDRALTQRHVLLDGLAIGESARWHDGRLWFANWGTGEIHRGRPRRSLARYRVRGCRRRRCRSRSTGCRTGRLLVVAGTPAAAPGAGRVAGPPMPDLGGRPRGFNEIVARGRRPRLRQRWGLRLRDRRRLGDRRPGPGRTARSGRVAEDIAFGNGMAITPGRGLR